MRWLGLVAGFVVDLFAPPACAACGADVSGKQVFCEACGHSARRCRELVQGVPLATAGRYEDPLRSAIVRLKYQGRAELARPLARLLEAPLAELAVPPEAWLAPVPMHGKRIASRGYNQAALLAGELAKLSGMRHRPRLLERTRHVERQVGQGREARRANVENAFRCREATSSPIVLVDDVVTTGATVSACARALGVLGVRLCGVVALARAEDDS